jgi:glycosyltransferase involved in cell wall biosynthesis
MEVPMSKAAHKVKHLTVLIPVFNSEDTIGPLVDSLVENLQPRFDKLEILLINDGSDDRSHERALEALAKFPGVVRYIRLMKNFGEHAAVLCGCHYASGDAVVVMDDDFQNPPSEVILLVEKLEEGYDVVYSCYESIQYSWFRRLGSAFNNRIASWVLKKPKDLYLSSFKAMTASLVEILARYEGPFPYIDGIILRSTRSIGRQPCKHDPRMVGQSTYTLRRLVRLWLNMFTGYSLAPLRIASFVGISTSLLGLFLAIYFFAIRMSGGSIFGMEIHPGWASAIVGLTLLSGLHFLFLGLIGEYVGRLMAIATRSPQFLVRDTFGIEENRS